MRFVAYSSIVLVSLARQEIIHFSVVRLPKGSLTDRDKRKESVMDALNDDTPALTKAVAQLSAEEMVRQRLAEEAAAIARSNAEYEVEREQSVRNFPVLLEQNRAEIGDQIRMTLYYLNDHGWSDCILLDVVGGYTTVTYKKWFKIHTYYKQRTQTLAACPLWVQDRARLHLASDGQIYQRVLSRYTDERGEQIEGYHDINSSHPSSGDVFWPNADDTFAKSILNDKTEAIVRALKKVRHEKLT
jgi:hypothetical protein